MLFVLSLIFVLIFAAIHAGARYMRFISSIPRRRYLSLAGGIAVSYVFLHLLPQLDTPDEHEHAASNELMHILSQNPYLMALAGLFVFYALDRLVAP
ncbi:hypothetical protein [Jeotgalibacillus proteolyticus]|uniref:hypothetical protein n=1 Tax=Jeotgalibacillus proteolyticus TaxID=2082395 RepID=UPI0026C6F337